MYFFEFRSINCPCHYWILYDFHIFIFFLWTHWTISAFDIVQWSKRDIRFIENKCQFLLKERYPRNYKWDELVSSKIAQKYQYLSYIISVVYHISSFWSWDNQVIKNAMNLCLQKLHKKYQYLLHTFNFVQTMAHGLVMVTEFEGVRESLKMFSKVWLCN